jgi:molecular chaperone GrpE
MAELENFRKRSRREIENSINFANASVLRELLDVLDNFERAQGVANNGEEGAGEAYIEGMRLIYQRFVEVLRLSGLERIPAKGEEFDPNLHEAVSQIETDEVPSGCVAHVVQDGYRLKEMVLRPAKVVVAK